MDMSNSVVAFVKKLDDVLTYMPEKIKKTTKKEFKLKTLAPRSYI